MSDYDLQQAQAHFAARLAFTTDVYTLDRIVQQGGSGAVIVDARQPRDFRQGHVPGAINLSKGKWRNPRGLSRDAVHYVYCHDQTCHLAAAAALELTRQGYKAVEVEGGWDLWTKRGFRSETETQVA